MRLLSQADPEQYKRLGRVYDWRVQTLRSQKAMAAVDPGMWFEGRELQFNRFSLAHFDIQDPHWGWVIIIYYGTFGCCTLELRTPSSHASYSARVVGKRVARASITCLRSTWTWYLVVIRSRAMATWTSFVKQRKCLRPVSARSRPEQKTEPNTHCIS